ncbi:CPCC family cysteine-rich protein [Streptomyces olivoreticuli]
MTSSEGPGSFTGPDGMATGLAAPAKQEVGEAGPRRSLGPAPEPQPVQVLPDGWFPCPCCGHRMFSGLWSDKICGVCFWQDDPFQLRYPWAQTGANGGLSLVEAQANYQKFGAMDARFRRQVRPPSDDEPLEPGWHPLDPSRDPFEREASDHPMPDDLTALYWWRPNYWRQHVIPAATVGPARSEACE